MGHRVGVAVGHGGDELPEVEPRLVLAQVQPCMLRVLPPVRHVPCPPSMQLVKSAISSFPQISAKQGNQNSSDS